MKQKKVIKYAALGAAAVTAYGLFIKKFGSVAPEVANETPWSLYRKSQQYSFDQVPISALPKLTWLNLTNGGPITF